MKRVVVSLPSLALGVSLLSAIPKLVSSFQSAHTAAVSARTGGRHIGSAAGTVARAFAVAAPLRRLGDDRADLRRRVREGQAGTYIADILRLRDSSLARWADRHGVPLTVWIQPSSRVTDFTPAFVARVRQAFQEWDALNLPVHFAFADDSADAEVHVNWIDHFNEPISGRTRWARDDDWVITDANIVLAVHHNQGSPLDDDAMRAMALHEIGHLLGLDHTTDSLAIMAPKVRVRSLSDADRATVRLLYALPAGPLR